MKTFTTTHRTTTSIETRKRIENATNAVIVDVRFKEAYTEKRIANAITLPLEKLTNQWPTILPDLDAEIYIYCDSFDCSQQNTQRLVALDYTNVFDIGPLDNGIYRIVEREVGIPQEHVFVG
ncbi:rhodanese-like domain-containing protein [Lachnospiraceae bacterium LCP25S3_G4]